MALENFSEAMDSVAAAEEQVASIIEELGAVEELCDEAYQYLSSRAMESQHILPVKNQTIVVREVLSAARHQLETLVQFCSAIQLGG